VIAVGDIGIDSPYEFIHAGHREALQLALRPLGERIARRGWEAPVGMKWKWTTVIPLQPLSHLLVLVGGVVVEDHMDLEPGFDALLDGLHELEEFLVPVPRHALVEDLAGRHLEIREDGRRPMTLLVVCHRAGTATLEREPGLRAVSAWIWLFSSKEETTVLAGRFR
jgi:hypothetical protein